MGLMGVAWDYVRNGPYRSPFILITSGRMFFPVVSVLQVAFPTSTPQGTTI